MKPILMNTEMVKAILDGRKTVTRRLIKPQPKGKLDLIVGGSNVGKWVDLENEEYWIPPCHCGDVLYVMETWCKFVAEHVIDGIWYEYKADATPACEATRKCYGYKWHPSIHMPKEAARIFLRVTGVRVERLRQRLIDDLEAEGFNKPFSYFAVLNHFADIWESTIKKADLAKYGWDANPWVWVIEFERISREEALENA